MLPPACRLPLLKGPREPEATPIGSAELFTDHSRGSAGSFIARPYGPHVPQSRRSSYLGATDVAISLPTAIAERSAHTTWTGGLAGGEGTVTSGSGALQGLPVTWAARTREPNGLTSPEELAAAAHSSCFAMALALRLGEHDITPQRLMMGEFPAGSEIIPNPYNKIAGFSVRDVHFVRDEDDRDAAGRGAPARRRDAQVPQGVGRETYQCRRGRQPFGRVGRPESGGRS